MYQSPLPLRTIWERLSTAFTPTDLVQSLSTQLAAELMKMYCDGRMEMQEKVLLALVINKFISLERYYTDAFSVNNSPWDGKRKDIQD